MRNKRLILVALAIVAGSMFVPTAAFAAGGETGVCLQELAEQINSGELTDEASIEAQTEDCFSAPSPVIPAWNEVIWGGLAFAIVAGGLIKFGFPSVKKGLQAREDKIREDLASAENSKQVALQKANEYEDKLKDARTEATEIIEKAKVQASEVKTDLVAKAEEEAAQIRHKAQVDAQQIADRALNDIQSQVAQLSVDLAEKVVKSNLDNASQLDLVNAFIADLPKTSKN